VPQLADFKRTGSLQMEGPAAADVALDQRLRECRQGGARAVLNLGYLGGLPEDFVPRVLRANPQITELDLSRSAVIVSDAEFIKSWPLVAYAVLFSLVAAATS
jgi:hypothetical protein